MISYERAFDTARAALRYNRVALAEQDDWLNDRALRAYININAFEMHYASGRTTGYCAVSLSFSLNTATRVRNPVTGGEHFATIEFCHRGSLLTIERMTVSKLIDDNITNYVNSCVTEYGKSVSK